MRVGFGYDIHPLVEGRRLVLGGVTLESPVGPQAHSDGDVLVHALCDALLGALGAGDLGTHFPDTDEQWRDARSLDFLLTVKQLLDEHGLVVANLDATVILERPAIGPHRGAMQRNIAAALSIAPEQIGIKATTHEGLGELGEGRAVAAMAVALIEVR